MEAILDDVTAGGPASKFRTAINEALAAASTEMEQDLLRKAVAVVTVAMRPTIADMIQREVCRMALHAAPLIPTEFDLVQTVREHASIAAIATSKATNSASKSAGKVTEVAGRVAGLSLTAAGTGLRNVSRALWGSSDAAAEGNGDTTTAAVDTAGMAAGGGGGNGSGDGGGGGETTPARSAATPPPPPLPASSAQATAAAASAAFASSAGDGVNAKVNALRQSLPAGWAL